MYFLYIIQDTIQDFVQQLRKDNGENIQSILLTTTLNEDRLYIRIEPHTERINSLKVGPKSLSTYFIMKEPGKGHKDLDKKLCEWLDCDETYKTHIERDIDRWMSIVSSTLMFTKERRSVLIEKTNQPSAVKIIKGMGDSYNFSEWGNLVVDLELKYGHVAGYKGFIEWEGQAFIDSGNTIQFDVTTSSNVTETFRKAIKENLKALAIAIIIQADSGDEGYFTLLPVSELVREGYSTPLLAECLQLANPKSKMFFLGKCITNDQTQIIPFYIEHGIPLKIKYEDNIYDGVEMGCNGLINLIVLNPGNEPRTIEYTVKVFRKVMNALKGNYKHSIACAMSNKSVFFPELFKIVFPYCNGNGRVSLLHLQDMLRQAHINHAPDESTRMIQDAIDNVAFSNKQIGG